MEPDFWRQAWSDGRTAFHQQAGNPLLGQHVDVLSLGVDDRVLVPMCGKTGDLVNLLALGVEVIGVELVESAVEDLFDALDADPVIARAGKLSVYQYDRLTVLVGDVFDVEAAHLGEITAIYDRAALVALPDDLRRRYAAHLAAITGAAPQLLLTFEYDQAVMDGPPFSVGADEVDALYGAHYDCHDLGGTPCDLKGIGATERVWHLT